VYVCVCEGDGTAANAKDTFVLISLMTGDFFFKVAHELVRGAGSARIRTRGVVV